MPRDVLIQVRRGLERDIGVLAPGEMGFCTDTEKLYIGSTEGNVLLIAAQNTGDMLKSIYDTNNDGVVDRAFVADSVGWSDISGKPSTFAPSSHTHSISQVTNLQSQLDNKETPAGAQAKADQAEANAKNASIPKTGGLVSGSLDVDGIVSSREVIIHHPTKAINNSSPRFKFVYSNNGDLELWSMLSDGTWELRAVLGKRNSSYMSIGGKTVETEDGAQSKVDVHENKKDNPHSVTKAQVGLGSVPNYGVATQAESQAGSVNTKFMTPLRVKEAIDALETKPPVMSVAGKIGDVSLSKSDVGLSSVQNYEMASQAQAEAGTTNTVYMTPLRVKQAINKLAAPPKSSFTWNDLRGGV